MATQPVYPAVGLSIPVPTADDSPCPTSGYQAEIPFSDYIQGCVDRGELRTEDPLDAGTTPTRDDYAYAIYVTDLATRNGSYGGEVISVVGYSASTRGLGGEGLYWWDATSTTAQNYGTVAGTLTLGRWERVYDGLTVDPAWFGAYGDNSTNDTAAIQAAINTGKNVDFRGRTYRCVGLTASTNFQRFISTGGKASLTKNANGVLFTTSANDTEFENLDFRGGTSSPTPEYTGHNVVASGNRTFFFHCHSTRVAGRALLATGGPTRIFGGVWATADDTASGYDIELGQTGVSTLYSTITGIGTAQSFGGIKLVGAGSVSISNSQFGKLRAEQGGVGAGGVRVDSCRVNGDISSEQSLTVIMNSAIAANLTFEAGSSSCIATGNTYQGTSVLTNNGNGNNVIERQVSSGGLSTVRYGDDTSLCEITYDHSAGGIRLSKGLRIANGSTLDLRNAADSGNATIGMTAGNVMQIYNGYNYAQIGASGGLQFTSKTIHFGQATFTAKNPPAQDDNGASQLSYDFNNVSVVANANDSVTLPDASSNLWCWVCNSGANTLQVFPSTGDDLGAGVNTSITLAAGAKAMWWCLDGGTWLRFI